MGIRLVICMNSKADITKCSENTNKQHEILALAKTTVRLDRYPILSAAAILIPMPRAITISQPSTSKCIYEHVYFPTRQKDRQRQIVKHIVNSNEQFTVLSPDTTQNFKCILFRVRPIPCRRLIPDTIGRSYTDTNTNTNTGLYKFFVPKMHFGVGYRCVQVIYV